VRESVAARSLAVALVVVAAAGSIACAGSRIDSLDRQRGAPGEEFTINGTKLDNFDPPPAVAPRLNRCGDFTLDVTQWFANSVRGRIPANVPAGVYGVSAFGEPSGAYQRGRTNSLPFWVLAAPVPDALSNAYEAQVRSFRVRYGKSTEWEGWMIANRDRYEPVFLAAHALACPVTVAVTYQTPLAYNPPWASEAQHMKLLGQTAEVSYPGYRFDFRYGVDPGSTYAHAILGVPGDSHNSGRDVYLHYETIFAHEFGHVLKLLHHYDDADLSTVGKGLHFPPGESGCLMDRNSGQFCSACRTALNIPLDANPEEPPDPAGDAILARYPPGW
jgi:hypothetical protein